MEGDIPVGEEKFESVPEAANGCEAALLKLAPSTCVGLICVKGFAVAFVCRYCCISCWKSKAFSGCKIPACIAARLVSGSIESPMFEPRRARVASSTEPWLNMFCRACRYA
jgi:hypothetical protein